MNWDIVKGKAKQFEGMLREEFGDLTDDEIEQAKGDRAKAVGLLQEKYGKSKDEAERHVDNLLDKLAA